jgi:uncharacterized protein (DUF305 family)
MRRSHALPVTLILVLGIVCGRAIQSMAGEPERFGTTSQQPLSFDQLVSTSIEWMHSEMMFSPSGDPDRDFARMMIPHHAGAVEMAKAELLYGRNQVLRRLAESIVVEQNQEIAVMRRALAEMSPIHNSTSSSADDHSEQLSNGRASEHRQ